MDGVAPCDSWAARMGAFDGTSRRRTEVKGRRGVQRRACLEMREVLCAVSPNRLRRGGGLFDRAFPPAAVFAAEVGDLAWGRGCSDEFAKGGVHGAIFGWDALLLALRRTDAFSWSG